MPNYTTTSSHFNNISNHVAFRHPLNKNSYLTNNTFIHVASPHPKFFFHHVDCVDMQASFSHSNPYLNPTPNVSLPNVSSSQKESHVASCTHFNKKFSIHYTIFQQKYRPCSFIQLFFITTFAFSSRYRTAIVGIYRANRAQR